MHGVGVGVGQAPQVGVAHGAQVGVGVAHGTQVGVGVGQGQHPAGQLTVGEGDGDALFALPLSIRQRHPGRNRVLAATTKRIHTHKFFFISFTPFSHSSSFPV